MGVTVHLEFTLVQLAVPLVPFPSGEATTSKMGLGMLRATHRLASTERSVAQPTGPWLQCSRRSSLHGRLTELRAHFSRQGLITSLYGQKRPKFL